MAEQQAPPLTIQEFLEARLDAAGAGVRWRRARVHAMTCDGFPSDDTDSGYAEAASNDTDNCTCGGPEAALADIAAKRAILRRYKRLSQEKRWHWQNYALWANNKPEKARNFKHSPHEHDELDGLEAAMKLLAEPYRAHPDWREKW